MTKEKLFEKSKKLDFEKETNSLENMSRDPFSSHISGVQKNHGFQKNDRVLKNPCKQKKSFKGLSEIAQKILNDSFKNSHLAPKCRD